MLKVQKLYTMKTIYVKPTQL